MVVTDIESTSRLGKIAEHRRLSLAILATRVAKIKRITVQSQPRQIVRKTLS
jgi:hypothetical protein